MTDPAVLAKLRRWRLVLGKDVEEPLGAMAGGGGGAGGGCGLDPDQLAMDAALAAIYDETTEDGGAGGRGGRGGRGSGRGGGRAGLGGSAPNLAKWLGDIRTYFTNDVVSVIQHDAIERRGLRQLLFEPEVLRSVEPDIQLVGELMALSGQIPEKTKETAREVVRKVVERIRLDLEPRLRQAVHGALNKREHSPIPQVASIDWKTTIRRNLRNWDAERRVIIPERISFFARGRKTNAWTVIVDMDQSGSMAESVVYGAITGAIFATLPALNTRVVVFDTNVVDLTEACGDDPVDMLFGVQLGGGTDIEKSVAYCQQFITDPQRTLFILISDLIEGGNGAALVRRMEELAASGVRAITLLALNDSGAPSYDPDMAKRFAKVGVPCFACTPGVLPDLVHGCLRGDDLSALAERLDSRKGTKRR